MSQNMRCPYCGLLQDEPPGVKACSRCGGGLEYESQLPAGKQTYMQVQMELDQVAAPPNQNLERYLLLTIRTPNQVPQNEKVQSVSGREPLNFTAVLDISGSMQGEKIEHARAAVQQAVHHLQVGDALSLVTFPTKLPALSSPVLSTKRSNRMSAVS